LIGANDAAAAPQIDQAYFIDDRFEHRANLIRTTTWKPRIHRHFLAVH
jgi:hypothetical protein